ncbi:MAG: histidine kinase, partial [Flavobacteriales bacterium]|nr:histidine kinase [Flavobacteriales bacterium]
VSLADDLEVVKGYMQVEEMRTRGKFTFHLDVALAYLEQLIALKDSVRNKDNQKALFKADLKYANERRAFADSVRHAQDLAEAASLRTIESLRADRNRNRAIALGGGAALLLLAGGVFYRTDTRRRRAVHERDKARSESAALRAQMNPHFNNNALQAINSYLGEDDLASARKLVTHFARVMRQVLENSSKSEVSLADDLEVVKGYMQVEEMRTRGKFTFHLDVAPEVDLDEVHVPPLVFQPFLENAIWHGIMPKEGSGSIAMRLHRNGDALSCTIEDDGVGRGHAPQRDEASGTSMGSSITRSRLDLLGRLTGRKAWFEYLDVPLGTTVRITLPLT